jgi:hypothetical protein
MNVIRSLTGVGEIGGGRINKPLLEIFNECRSLTGMGELINPY